MKYYSTTALTLIALIYIPICAHAQTPVAASSTSTLSTAASPTEPTAKPAAESAKAVSGKASSPGNKSTKMNTKLPIEISSDTLEVFQQQNKAVFTGNVVSVQGTMRLKSDVMVVHYKSQKDAPDKSQKDTTTNAKPPAEAPKPQTDASKPKTDTPASAPQGDMGAITLIEVQGHVFMATPEESAIGDRGDYHVDDKMLHLYGDNVTLTKGKNILKGTALEYNMETGHSVLTNNGSKVTGGGRVHSLFVPSDAKDNTKTGAKDVKK